LGSTRHAEWLLLEDRQRLLWVDTYRRLRADTLPFLRSTPQSQKVQARNDSVEP